MARWGEVRAEAPAELAAFDASDWPDEPDPLRAWSEAARAWLAGHPGRDLAPGLDDPVAVLEEAARLRPLAAGPAECERGAVVVPIRSGGER